MEDSSIEGETIGREALAGVIVVIVEGVALIASCDVIVCTVCNGQNANILNESILGGATNAYLLVVELGAALGKCYTISIQ
jgi:hypothetical protein